MAIARTARRAEIDDPAALTGAQKVAVVLLALGDEKAALWEQLDAEEVRAVSRAMSSLGAVSPGVAATLLAEFEAGMAATPPVVGSTAGTERLLRSVSSDGARAAAADNMRGAAGDSVWNALGHVSEAVLANYLKREYPQTAALVLSKLSTDHAGRVLTALPDAFALDCVQRMLRIEPVRQEILDGVEQVLREEVLGAADAGRSDNHESVARILGRLERSAEDRLISALEVRDPPAAERVRALMFTFDDLASLDPGGVQTLIRAAEPALLSLALKGAPDRLRDVFLANMSERAGRVLREAMEDLGPVRLKAVDEAQAAVVALAKTLAERGEILIDGPGEDALVY